MKVHYSLAASLPAFTNAVVTVGTFDGVHLGHRQIIARLRDAAASIGGETVIITFHPHPRKVVSSVPGDVKLLSTLDEKIGLLSDAGIDHLVVIPFDHAFAAQTADEYITNFLYRYFKPHTVIIGYDHRFGKGREGDYRLLEKYGRELGFIVSEIPEQLLNDVAVSSTRIRKALGEADIDTANGLLGYPYFFEGMIVKGNQLGRTIGYPTANLHISSEEKLVPGNGVYAVTAVIATPDENGALKKEDRVLKGMMNIGVRPTIDGTRRVIEVNLFDFDEDIYGKTLQVHLHYYLRGEVKFAGLDKLKEQLLTDKNNSIQFLSGSAGK